MRFLSVCSGIEAASVAWNPIGWKAVAFSEIEPFPCAVLKHHYPDTPNWGDMTKYKEWPDEPIDLLCGGTPCQSFSVAGLRKGLDDPRGNLMLTFGAIAAKYRPKWLVWENVPGVLSSNGGRDFGTFLGMLGQLGYGYAYRVLDAQYFGVPQRRRRVFVVACLGDWGAAAAVLFERHSMSGHPAPSRETGEEAARCLTRGSGGGQRYDGESETFGANTLLAKPNSSHRADIDTYVAFAENSRSEIRLEGGDGQRVGALSTGGGKPGQGVPVIAFDCKSSGQNGFGIGVELAGTQRAMTHSSSHSNGGGHQAVALQSSQSGVRIDDVHATLDSNNGPRRHNGALLGMQVRRLTPRECERLQSFPDDYTQIAWRKRAAADCPDGPRYKALGNSWCVNNVLWIGRRIDHVNALTRAVRALSRE